MAFFNDYYEIASTTATIIIIISNPASDQYNWNVKQM